MTGVLKGLDHLKRSSLILLGVGTTGWGS